MPKRKLRSSGAGKMRLCRSLRGNTRNPLEPAGAESPTRLEYLLAHRRSSQYRGCQQYPTPLRDHQHPGAREGLLRLHNLSWRNLSQLVVCSGIL